MYAHSSSDTPSSESGPGLFIGIDGGGSKTELRAVLDDGSSLPDLVLRGPGTNVAALGVDEVAGRLEALVLEAWRARSNAPLVAICAGLAGAGRAEVRAQLAVRLRQRLATTLGPAADGVVLELTTDGPIALESAFGTGSGVVVMAGTGSIAFGRLTDGSVLRVGGWGRLIGDDGSGYALGRQALRAAAAALEGGPDSLVARLFDERYDIRTRDRLLQRVYEDDWAPQHEPASVLLEAAEAGDAVARSLLLRECAAFIDQIRRLIDRLPADAVERRFALFGGLFRQPFYRFTLTRQLAAAFPEWRVEAPEAAASEGAVRLARRAAGRG